MQRLAARGISDRHSPQILVVGVAAGAGFCIFDSALIIMKMAKATITKSSTVLTNNAVIDGRGAGLLRFGERGIRRVGEIDEQAAEVNAAHQLADRRHDHVADQ